VEPAGNGPLRLGYTQPMTDFDLDRFVSAQDSRGTYEQALAELRRGRKASHWMWFVFPQVAGLGRSSIAQQYAVPGLDEARDYLRHPVLGPRLRECSEAVLGVGDDLSAEDVFGPVDAVKLRSSMTLFHRVDPAEQLFAAVLERFFEGRPDPRTDELLT
jgi:uncharacterized protein (DUF1810 family)